MEPAAPRFAVLPAVVVLLLALAAPAVGAPGPDGAPGHGSGPQPEPSGGRPRATVTVHSVSRASPAPARAPRAVVTPSPKRAPKPHREHPRHNTAPLAPRSAPSAVFNSLRSAAQVPGRADTARGIHARSLELAAAALLLVVAIGGSFLTLVSQMPRTR